MDKEARWQRSNKEQPSSIRHQIIGLISQKKLELVLLEVFGLLLFLITKSSPYLTILRVVTGLFSLLILPGYFLVKISNLFSDLIEIWSLSPLFGAIYQLFVVYLMFVVSTVFNEINFSVAISAVPLVPTLLYLGKSGIEVLNIKKGSEERGLSSIAWLGMMVVLGLILRINYQRVSVNPHTDTSLFCEMARNLFEKGKFTSKVIMIQRPAYFKGGFNPHPFAYFSYAIFFAIGGPSYFSTKLATIFYGMIAILLAYLFVRRFYDERVALISLFLMIFHPIIVFFTSIPINGSEIIGVAFLFSTVYLFSLGLVKGCSSKYMLLAGLSAFATLASRAEYFYVFVLCSPFLVFSLIRINGELDLHRYVKASLILYLSLLLRFSDFLAIPSSFIHLLIPISVLVLNILFYLFWKVEEVMGFTAFNAIIAFLMVLSVPNAYLLLRSPPTPLHGIIVKKKGAVMLAAFLDMLRKALLLSLDFKEFPSRFGALWQITLKKLSIPIFIASILTMALVRKLSNLFLSLFVFAYLTILSLSRLPIGGVDHHRFLLAIFFILITFSAQTIHIILDRILKSVKKGFSIYIRISLKLSSRSVGFYFRKLNLLALGAVLAIALMFSMFLYPLYLSEVYVVRSTDIRAIYRYDDAIEWVVKNTAPDSVLMAYKPYEWAWYTNRTSLMPFPLHLNLSQLCYLIRLFKVNYLIIDETFYCSYSNKEVRSLYLLSPQEGFVKVFSSSTKPSVVIYNVTSIWSDNP